MLLIGFWLILNTISVAIQCQIKKLKRQF